GEIEAQLVTHGEVKEAVVLAREDEPGHKRLVGYVIARAGGTPSTESLRAYLRGILPEYMVPSAFVLMKTFPLTPNGKLDRRALPAPDQSAYAQRKYEAPRGEVEEILAGIWQELLKLERVGRNDNFFELGGHSLLGIKLVGAAKAVLGCSLPVSAVFRYPSISELAAVVTSLQRADTEALGSDSGEYEEGFISLDTPGGAPLLGISEVL